MPCGSTDGWLKLMGAFSDSKPAYHKEIFPRRDCSHRGPPRRAREVGPAAVAVPCPPRHWRLGRGLSPPKVRQETLQPPQAVRSVPVVHQIPTFQIGVNIMQVNGLCRIHIVLPVDCVWPLCTAGAGNCVIKTARNRRKRTFYVLKNRLAVMHRLAVHNVKTANCAILAQCAVQRGGDIVSLWLYVSCGLLQR